MKRMYKYLLSMNGTTTPEMPAQAVIKHIGYQNGVLSLWAEVEVEHEAEAPYERKLMVIGTGHEVPVGGNYVTTVHDPDNFHIWHVYSIRYFPAKVEEAPSE